MTPSSVLLRLPQQMYFSMLSMIAWMLAITSFVSASSTHFTTTSTHSSSSLPTILPTCFEPLQAFSLLPTSPLFPNVTSIQQPLLTPTAAPAFVSLPLSESDLQLSLSCAALHGLQVSIKSGGHSFAGYSRVAAPGFMISLERMTSVQIDETNHTVRVTGAARWEHVYDAFAHSQNTYQVVGGLCPTVGVMGYTSGGGVGPLARKYGLAADNVLSLRLVLANGSDVLQVDAHSHPDLFFAVRGSGGGQFGVISELTFQAHLGVPAYTWGSLCYNNATQDVLMLMAQYAELLPRDVNMDAEVDSLDSICLWIVAALPKAETLAALQPFLQPTASGAQPTLTFQELNCFWETIQAFAIAKGYSAYSSQPFVLTSVMLPALNNETAQTISKAAAQLPADACGQSMIHFGGRIREISVNESAFPWRDSAYMLYASCGYDATQPGARASVTSALQSWHESLSSVVRGSYVNFIDPNLVDWEWKYFGSHLDRLRQIKSKYNPAGVGPLRFAQEIGASGN